MWRKDEPQAPSLPAQTKSASVTTVLKTPPLDQTKPATLSPGSPQGDLLTRLLCIKGEITGQDELLIDGEVHGKIRLQGGKLTIGPNGRVTAEIEAREVVVRGEVTGNIKGHDRVQIAATGRVRGEINTRLISIEEGAEVHVQVNLEKEERPRPAGAIGADSSPHNPDNKVQIPLTEEVSRVHA
jgi:cytoskeletal protein CcmA (bactofilin family)